ncbi:hypothetical protein, partial [Rhodopirellula sallentina]|uniref:hypothetical protein n=1 Tax=Rhodopirellula sallentina TaxID=1263869 RepID=UPI0005C7CDA0
VARYAPGSTTTLPRLARSVYLGKPIGLFVVETQQNKKPISRSAFATVLCQPTGANPRRLIQAGESRIAP